MSHYLISEAARLVDEESHVLRYWEDELALKIPRNDLGHRYYTEVQLEIFRTIKDLKHQGYQLKEIKQYLEEMEKKRLPDSGASEAAGDGADCSCADGTENAEVDCRKEEAEEANGADVQEVSASDPSVGGHQGSREAAPPLTVRSAVPSASAHQQARMQEFRELMTDILADAMEAGLDRMGDELSDQISRRIIKELNYLDREREEREEERFKALDEAIRSRQRKGKFRAEAAATAARNGKRRRWGEKPRTSG